MYESFAFLVIPNGLVIQRLLNSLKRLNLMSFMLISAFINTGDTNNLLIGLTIEIKQVLMFGTNSLSLIKLIQLIDSLLCLYDIIDGESIKFIKTQ